MGLLDGPLQRVALGAFGSLLLNGNITRKVVVQTRDGRGRITQAPPDPPAPCKAFYDVVTIAMRANGYGSKDVQIICLQLSPDGTQIVDPAEGDTIEITQAGQTLTWRIAAPIAADPAKAAWTFRGTPP